MQPNASMNGTTCLVIESGATRLQSVCVRSGFGCVGSSPYAALFRLGGAVLLTPEQVLDSASCFARPAGDEWASGYCEKRRPGDSSQEARGAAAAQQLWVLSKWMKGPGPEETVLVA